MPLFLEASFPDSPDGVFWAGERLVCTLVVRNEPDAPQTPRGGRRRSSTRLSELINPFGPGLGAKPLGNTDDTGDALRTAGRDAPHSLARNGIAGSMASNASLDLNMNNSVAAGGRPGIISSVMRSVGRGALTILGLGNSSPTEGPETPVEPSLPTKLVPEQPPASPERDPDIPARTDASRILAPAPQHPPPNAAPTVIKLNPISTPLARIDELRSESATPVEAPSPSITPAPLSTSVRRPNSAAAGGTWTENLPYGFVQMFGTFQADPASISMTPFDSLKSRAMYFPSSGLGHGGGGSLMANPGNAGKDDRSVPVYSTPPSILFVDLRLEPGETRTYTYSLLLPDVLPPSHRGRLARFSYKLVVGIQRGSITTRTQNFQVPFRLFNRVEGGGFFQDCNRIRHHTNLLCHQRTFLVPSTTSWILWS
jgi:hypothetical protein